MSFNKLFEHWVCKRAKSVRLWLFARSIPREKLDPLSHDPLLFWIVVDDSAGGTPWTIGTQWGKKCCLDALDIQLKISEVNQICIHSLVTAVTVWRGGIHHLRCTCQMLCSVGSKLQKQSLKLPRINTVQKCIESHQYSAHCTSRSITIPENNPNMCGNSERIDCMRTLDWAHGVCTCISWLLLPTWHLLSWAGSHLFHNMFHYNFMISDSGRNWAL